MVAVEEPDVREAARRALWAAEEANKAAEADPNTPHAVRTSVSRVLQESQTVLAVAISSPRKRQTFAEFTSMLGEEVKEAAEESMQEGMLYAERSWRKAKSIIEDHFQVDEAFRLLGPLRQDSNLARDVHDWFNLVALLPVIALNLMNWDCHGSTVSCCLLTCHYRITQLWHGEAFLTFWWATFAYFIVDVLFVLLLPKCVKSPKVIVQHHLATIGYIMIPKVRPQYGWLMGACMVVEVNTWFLIARRAFNKKGDKPFSGVPLTKCIRLCVVSTCFYVSWFVIRLGFYPYLLVVIMGEWYMESQRVGTPFNLIAITPVMQCIFIFLNAKWTFDLIRSKLKGRGPGKGL